MLVLSRKEEQSIVFPNLGISIEIVKVQGNRVSVGVEAPKAIRVVRGELQNNGDHPHSNLQLLEHLEPFIEFLAPRQKAALHEQVNVANASLQAASSQLAQLPSSDGDQVAPFLNQAIEALAQINRMLASPSASATNDCVKESSNTYSISSSNSRSTRNLDAEQPVSRMKARSGVLEKVACEIFSSAEDAEHVSAA